MLLNVANAIDKNKKIPNLLNTHIYPYSLLWNDDQCMVFKYFNIICIHCSTKINTSTWKQDDHSYRPFDNVFLFHHALDLISFSQKTYIYIHSIFKMCGFFCTFTNWEWYLYLSRPHIQHSFLPFPRDYQTKWTFIHINIYIYIYQSH